METSLTGKAVDFGSIECGFESHVSNKIKYNSYAYLVNHINILTSSKQRWALIVFNKKLLRLLILFKRLGFINSSLIVSKKNKRLKLTPFLYKNSTFFKGVRLISTPSKAFIIKLKSLRLLNQSLRESLLILETSRGILTHKEALKLRVGGRLLCVLG